jgi:hypothetical protein
MVAIIRGGIEGKVNCYGYVPSTMYVQENLVGGGR